MLTGTGHKGAFWKLRISTSHRNRMQATYVVSHFLVATFKKRKEIGESNFNNVLVNPIYPNDCRSARS